MSPNAYTCREEEIFCRCWGGWCPACWWNQSPNPAQYTELPAPGTAGGWPFFRTACCSTPVQQSHHCVLLLLSVWVLDTGTPGPPPGLWAWPGPPSRTSSCRRWPCSALGLGWGSVVTRLHRCRTSVSKGTGTRSPWLQGTCPWRWCWRGQPLLSCSPGLFPSAENWSRSYGPLPRHRPSWRRGTPPGRPCSRPRPSWLSPQRWCWGVSPLTISVTVTSFGGPSGAPSSSASWSKGPGVRSSRRLLWQSPSSGSQGGVQLPRSRWRGSLWGGPETTTSR